MKSIIVTERKDKNLILKRGIAQPVLGSNKEILSGVPVSTNYYVDLSNAAGVGTGAAMDPFGINQMISRILTGGPGVDEDAYYCRGVANTTLSNTNWGESDPTKRFFIRAWNVRNYGPWIWHGNAKFNNAALHNGIIYSEDFDIYFASAFGCFISKNTPPPNGYSGIYIKNNTYPSYIKGCTIQTYWNRIHVDPAINDIRIEGSNFVRKVVEEFGLGSFMGNENAVIRAKNCTFEHVNAAALVYEGTFVNEGQNQWGWTSPVVVPFTPGQRGYDESMSSILKDKSFLQTPPGMTTPVNSDIDTKTDFFGAPRVDGRTDGRTHYCTGVGAYWFRQEGMKLNDLASTIDVTFKDRNSGCFERIATSGYMWNVKVWAPNIEEEGEPPLFCGWERASSPVIRTIPTEDPPFTHKVTNVTVLAWIAMIRNMNMGNFRLFILHNQNANRGKIEFAFQTGELPHLMFCEALSDTVLFDFEKWYMVAATADSVGNASFYWNGAPLGVAVPTAKIILLDELLGGSNAIMRGPNLTGSWTYYNMQDIFAYTQVRFSNDRALTAGEIQTIYNNEKDRLPPFDLPS